MIITTNGLKFTINIATNIATNITTNITTSWLKFTTKTTTKLDKSLIEIHHMSTTSSPQVHHKSTTTSWQFHHILNHHNLWCYLWCFTLWRNSPHSLFAVFVLMVSLCYITPCHFYWIYTRIEGIVGCGQVSLLLPYIQGMGAPHLWPHTNPVLHPCLSILRHAAFSTFRNDTSSTGPDTGRTQVWRSSCV